MSKLDSLEYFSTNNYQAHTYLKLQSNSNQGKFIKMRFSNAVIQKIFFKTHERLHKTLLEENNL